MLILCAFSVAFHLTFQNGFAIISNEWNKGLFSAERIWKRIRAGKRESGGNPERTGHCKRRAGSYGCHCGLTVRRRDPGEDTQSQETCSDPTEANSRNSGLLSIRRILFDCRSRKNMADGAFRSARSKNRWTEKRRRLPVNIFCVICNKRKGAATWKEK